MGGGVVLEVVATIARSLGVEGGLCFRSPCWYKHETPDRRHQLNYINIDHIAAYID
jgi:hypothetical protein